VTLPRRNRNERGPLTTTPEHDKLQQLRDLNEVAADIAQLLLDSDSWQLINTGAGPAVTVGVKRVLADVLDIDIEAWQSERIAALGIDISNRRAFGVLAGLAYDDEAAKLPSLVDVLDATRANAVEEPQPLAGISIEADFLAEEERARAAEAESATENGAPVDPVHEAEDAEPFFVTEELAEPEAEPDLADHQDVSVTFVADGPVEADAPVVFAVDHEVAEPVEFVDEEAGVIVVFDEPAVDSPPVPSLNDEPEPTVDTPRPPVPVAPVLVAVETDESETVAEPVAAPSKSSAVKSFYEVGNYSLLDGIEDESEPTK
jgi:hypothetical protein